MVDNDSTSHQQALLETYRRNLRHLLNQIAHYGGASEAPLSVINGIRETRTQIQQLKADLRTLGVSVEDSPGDMESVDSVNDQVQSRYNTVSLESIWRYFAPRQTSSHAEPAQSRLLPTPRLTARL